MVAFSQGGSWHIASFRCAAPVRQQLGVKRTCHRHGWIDAIDPKRSMNEAAACTFPAMVTKGGGSLYSIVDDHSAGPARR